MVISQLVFDDTRYSDARARPGMWLILGALLVAGYIVFGLVFQGVQGLSRGGIVFAGAAFGWALVGIVTRQATCPPVLLLPLAFLTYTFLGGLQVEPYPLEYLLKFFTVWGGAMAVALFVANGLSMNAILAGLVLMCLANFAAMALGYDTHAFNVDDFDVETLEGVDVERHSGLAGQVNKLVGLLFVLPFAAFLLRRPVGLPAYVGLVAVCVAAAVMTGSRSTIVFSAIFVVAGALWLVRAGPVRLVLLAGGIAGSLVLATFLGSPQALSSIENSGLGELVLVKRTLSVIDGDDGSTETRESFATDFWPQFNVRPMVGYGPDRFKDVTNAGVYAHNNFAELAINGGLIGLLLYYAMYFVVAGGALTHGTALLAPLAFLIAADGGFVTMLARGMIVLLCLCLVIAYPQGGHRSAARRAGRSGRGARRRRRRAYA